MLGSEKAKAANGMMMGQSSDETSSGDLNHKAWLENEPYLCYPKKIDQIIKNAIFIAHHIGELPQFEARN